MATAVVVMLVPMEAVVVAATRRRCDGGVCGGAGVLLPRHWWQRCWMLIAESNTENELFGGLYEPGPGRILGERT
jgi:hypothetical protein